jgi:hypothetical protein
VTSVSKRKDSYRMHGMQRKEECPNRNPVFFCDFSEQTKRLSPNARKRGMFKDKFRVFCEQKNSIHYPENTFLILQIARIEIEQKPYFFLG